LYIVLDVKVSVFGLKNAEQTAIQTLDGARFIEDIKVFRDRRPAMIVPRELGGNDGTI
jgi:hypothetical protein